MSKESPYLIALFKSVSHVLQSEKLLIRQGVPHKIIPVPKRISSECGVCIRFLPEHRNVIEETLNGKIENFTIQLLKE